MPTERVHMGLVSETLLRLVKGRDNGIRAGLRRWASGASARPETAPAADRATSLDDADAPEGFTSVLRAAALGQNELLEVMVDGEPVLLCKVDGEVHAMSAVCPHAGGPLGEGTLEGHTVTCPYHGWSFDVRDGACQVTRDMDLPVFEVDVGEVISIRT